MAKEQGKLIANNKKAYHDYFILDTYEAGISLHGTEVKSLRMGKCSIKEAFIRIENEEVFVYGMHISPYEKGNIFNKDPLRVRKLLLHRSEINKITGKIKEKGMALVPLKVYFKGSLVKVEIGLAKGKKLYDKRNDIVFQTLLKHNQPAHTTVAVLERMDPLKLHMEVQNILKSFFLLGIVFRQKPFHLIGNFFWKGSIHTANFIR